MNEQRVYLGTELKLNIHIDPIESLTMDDYDFNVEVFCLPKTSITFSKGDAIRVDGNNYIVLVDTSSIGSGEIKCKVTAFIPDGDFPDGFRQEVDYVNTGVVISNGI